MKINIPLGAKKIIEILKNNGFKGYIVGGCVRDSLLDKEPKDWDITTNSPPEIIINIFKKTHKVIPTGIKHGTVTLLGEDNAPYEVTTFRKDGKYLDSRRPENVEFINDIYEDLSRRDFTVNAMAYNDEEGLIDYFSGLKDLKSNIIKCVGNPNERFNEDALRMLRAVRFASKLNFSIDKITEKAIKDNHSLIKNISIERIREEFNKIIISNPFKIQSLYEYGLLNIFLPEYELCVGVEQNNPYHIYNIHEHTLNSMIHIDEEIYLRLTMLFHDIGKPECKSTDKNGIDHFYGHAKISKNKSEEILKRMKYDNKTIEKVSILVQYHDYEIKETKSIKKLLNKIGEENLKDLLKVKIADMKSQNPIYFEDRYNKILEIREKLKEVLESNQCFRLNELALNGRDIIELGYGQGKEIGIILNKLLDKVIENPNINTREKLIELLENNYS